MSSNGIEAKFNISSKHGERDESVRIEFARLGLDSNILNLGQGCPDFTPPKHVADALASVAKTNDASLHQYTRSNGHLRLVNILAKLYSSLINREIDPTTEMLVTCGAHNALFLTIFGHIQPGDEIIIIEPFFDCYAPMVQMAGGLARFIPLRYKPKASTSGCLSAGDFILDQTELESLFNAKTKAILLNTPNNPLGKVFTLEELTTIADLCKKWNVLCIADEVYEWMVYKPNQHIRIASLPNMWERTITIGSAGKTFSITGWKTGWLYGPANLLKNIIIVFQTCIAAGNTPIQEAIAIIFEMEFILLETNPKESCLNALGVELSKKKDFLVECLSNRGIKPIDPEGGYFINADWTVMESEADILEDTEELKDIRMAKWVIKNLGLLGIPLSAFYSNEHKHLAANLIRFCFIKSDDKLKEVAEILMNNHETNNH